MKLLGLAWLLYFGLHSIMASLWFKAAFARFFPHWQRGYRLLFNLVAVFGLLPIFYLIAQIGGEPVYQPPFWWTIIGTSLALIGFIYSLKFYDGLDFIGLKQWREHCPATAESSRFCISPLHRWVRHPWYSLGLLLIWSHALNPPLLLSAILISLYLFIGSRWEEQKLVHYYGEVYRQYKQKVPALIPRPWKYLSLEEAAALQNGASSALSD